MANIYKQIDEIDDQLGKLPKGTLTYKKINGKEQPYVQRTIDGKSVSYYVKMDEREQVLVEFEKRNELLEKRKRLQAYADSLKDILGTNPYLDRKAGIGWQQFSDFIDMNMMYVDKTHFIKEWWESTAQISLITRPRRFGKTLMMSTVQNFFDPLLASHEERFQKLAIWREEKYRNLYGTIPVIFLSFASVRCDDCSKAIYSFKNRICEIYDDHLYLTNSAQLSNEDRDEFARRRNNLHDLNGSIREDDIQFLSRCIYYHHNVRPIILLDEYDTPLIDAYVSGCYGDIIKIYQTLFAQTFKMNRFFYRAIITGINKVSKNSLYSDMNNVRVYTMLNEGFEDCFGFTEQEVMDILKCQDIDLMKEVKANYDGFIVGKAHDIYNPWSICNFVLDGEFRPYWVNTSSNELISELIKAYPNAAKSDIEDLIQGKTLCRHINEDLALQYIKGDVDSFWALMVAVGYVTAEKIKTKGLLDEEEMCEYKLASTNAETNLMLKRQILAMFPARSAAYNDFTHYLVNGNIEMVNNVLNDILLNCISYFDTADSGGGKNPAENFYHGLVLGMIVKLKDKYNITSNRESGLGRYDICMIPLKEGYDAFIIEFKIRNHKTEASLEATAANALAQIDEKNYVASIRAQGIQDNNIRKLAFAFDGKEGLVVSA